MKKSAFTLLFYYLLITACNTRQQNNSNQKDSLQKKTSSKVDVEEQTARNLAEYDNMVKAESPDAETNFEQGYCLPRMNDGLAQSPVNIITPNLKSDLKQKNQLSFAGSINAIENLGHTIQVDFTNGSSTTFDGQSFELKQFHFHTPSEHLIDGVTFPMEMHIVNKVNDSVKNTGSKYVVMGILFKMGHENKFLKEFLDSVPKNEGKNSLKPDKVKLDDLFIEVHGISGLKEYQYQGSLTTQPYTEGVTWIIVSRIFEASEQQINTIEKIEGNNARHIHSLNSRKIALE